MKKYLPLVLKYLPWAFLIVCSILLVRQCGQDPKIEYIPVEVEVLVPSVEKDFDTIYKPTTVYVKVKEIDSSYYKKYVKLKDSVAKDIMFKEAIEINEYKQVFEDTLQTINVYTKSRGTVLSQSVSYKTKPYTIKVKDSVENKVKSSLSIGTELGIPTVPSLDMTPVVKGNIIFTNKKGNTFSASYDTEGKVWIGKSWKIRFKK